VGRGVRFDPAELRQAAAASVASLASGSARDLAGAFEGVRGERPPPPAGFSSLPPRRPGSHGHGQSQEEVIAALMRRIDALEIEREKGSLDPPASAFYGFDNADINIPSHDLHSLQSKSERAKMDLPLSTSVLTKISERFPGRRACERWVRSLTWSADGVYTQAVHWAVVLDGLLDDEVEKVRLDHPSIDYIVRRLLGLQQVSDAGGDWEIVEKYMAGAALNLSSLLSPDLEGIFTNHFEKTKSSKSKKKKDFDKKKDLDKKKDRPPGAPGGAKP
jgi:hypothetical protein